MTAIRHAISAEIKRITFELGRLQKILSQFDGSGDASTPFAATAPTGKRKYTRRQKSSAETVQEALKLIEKSGRDGIKAIKLAHEIKRGGGAKPAKADLLATEKVKMTGKGGGSTYVFVG